MELHDNGKFVCEMIMIIPHPKDDLLQFQSNPGLIEGLERERRYCILLPLNCGVKNYEGAHFSILFNHRPDLPPAPIRFIGELFKFRLTDVYDAFEFEYTGLPWNYKPISLI
jgi:hypothetical protein